MSNTIIQIKRSTVTASPASLNIAELAYSYTSNTLFIGNTNGTGVIAIGGAAFAIGANSYATSVGAASNAWANAVGTGANNQSGLMANAANSYAAATFVKLTSGTQQTVSSDISISGNLTVTGQTTYANTQTLLVGDNIVTLNADLPGSSAPSENAGIEVNRGSSSNVSLLWDESLDAWTFTNDGTNYKKIASNTDIENVNLSSVYGYVNAAGVGANTYANAVGVGANTFAASVLSDSYSYANAVGLGANTYASNANNINQGILNVAFGGTGVQSVTLNGVLFGRGGNGSLQVTSAGSEGQVLQASSTGVPQFGMLDGGSF